MQSVGSTTSGSLTFSEKGVVINISGERVEPVDGFVEAVTPRLVNMLVVRSKPVCAVIEHRHRQLLRGPTRPFTLHFLSQVTCHLFADLL